LLLAPTRPPREITVGFDKRRSLKVSWSPVLAYFTYGTVQGYKALYYEADSNMEEAKAQRARVPAVGMVIDGLKSYTNYCVSVAAFNENGVGNYSYPECNVTDEGGKNNISLVLYRE